MKGKAERTRTITVRLDAVEGNPFASHGNLNQERVEALKSSMKAEGYWENLVARKLDDGRVQLAYGHHRLQALRELRDADATIPIRIMDLDDRAMIRILAWENREEWRSSAGSYLAAIAAVVKGFAEGSIAAPSLGPKTRKTLVRHAPSFRCGRAGTTSTGTAYTGASIARFLGLPARTVSALLSVLALEERGYLDSGDLAGLSCRAVESIGVEMTRLLPHLRKELGVKKAKARAKELVGKAAEALRRGADRSAQGIVQRLMATARRPHPQEPESAKLDGVIRRLQTALTGKKGDVMARAVSLVEQGRLSETDRQRLAQELKGLRKRASLHLEKLG